MKESSCVASKYDRESFKKPQRESISYFQERERVIFQVEKWALFYLTLKYSLVVNWPVQSVKGTFERAR